FLQFNFVGKLLGPRGNSLKRLQEETLTKMSILGKGSMRDKTKVRPDVTSPHNEHRYLPLDQVAQSPLQPDLECFQGWGIYHVSGQPVPDYNDEIRQAQLQELTYLNGGSENAEVPVVRGKTSIRARGVPVPALSRGRGGVPPPPTGVPRGAPAPRGVPPSRGPVSRSRGLLAPRARGVPPPAGYRPLPPPPAQETYGEYVNFTLYTLVSENKMLLSNSQLNKEKIITTSENIGRGLTMFSLLAGQEEWTNSRHKAPSARTTKGVYRDQPYARY
ncbi:KHDR3 protein, partial [Corythaeola cristata]|nr:KHDR3 protein [Corythaeola cristata]